MMKKCNQHFFINYLQIQLSLLRHMTDEVRVVDVLHINKTDTKTLGIMKQLPKVLT